ncbi:LysR family transcriptional regulator [Pararhizobium mangrovi]|uniref:HTH-type transcriptional regulator TtuA n=1 Tax=Pararhizobium mangrovi TaxID=2590452 RepID=A0A506U3N9_9HYPH|nr:LysR family transcriptional regulator [Pararhizobium mangrovi]TPW28952.1 LysR family transcriptional regulator [Pararhizobium mangrovi]
MTLTRNAVPDIAVLQAFECAARHGSFTRAAEELNLTQSAVSRQIRALEEQFGVLLFERVRRRVVLSAAGRALMPPILDLLERVDDVMHRALVSADSKTVLRLAALPTFCNRWLMPRLSGFAERHPDILLDVVSRSQPFDLIAEEVDLAIHYGQPVWAHASCTYLCSEIILPVASPRFAAAGDIACANDLAGMPLLHLATRPQQWADWFAQNDAAVAAPHRGHRFDQFGTIIEAALAGLGIALLPVYLIEEELEAGRLHVLVDRPMRTRNGYYLVSPEGKTQDAAATAFRSWILTQVPKAPSAEPTEPSPAR